MTYESFAALGPVSEGPFAERLDRGGDANYVVSTTLETPKSTNVTVLDSGDATAQVAKLKDEIDGTILLAGSRRLVQELLGSDLVDQIELMIFPVILGTGDRMLGDMDQEDDVEPRRSAAGGRPGTAFWCRATAAPGRQGRTSDSEGVATPEGGQHARVVRRRRSRPRVWRLSRGRTPRRCATVSADHPTLPRPGERNAAHPGSSSHGAARGRSQSWSEQSASCPLVARELRWSLSSQHACQRHG